MDEHLLSGIILLLALLIGSAFFSAVETALIALSHHKLRVMRDKHHGVSGSIDKWLKNPNRVLTTMLIGINLTNIAAAVIAENIADIMVAKYHLPEWVSPVISIGVISIIVIEFCEIIPKILAYHNAEKYTLRMIKPLMFADRAMMPLGKALVGFGNFIIKLMGGKPGSPQGALVSEAEILSMVEMGEKEGVIEKEEQEMIRSIFEFGDTRVREVMVPYPDIHRAPADMTVADMAQYIEEVNHSRIPIYEDDEDNIIGIVNSKAMLKALKEGRDNSKVKGFSMPPLFVPETKMIDELLHEFQNLSMHMAIVVDEYGTVSGIVTLEDLLEEIVGEIRDEYDTEEALYRWLNATTLKAMARIDIEELNDAIDADIPDDDEYETLGGFILHTLGRVPKTGDILTHDRYQFKIDKMTGRRIISVIIRKLDDIATDSKNSEEKP